MKLTDEQISVFQACQSGKNVLVDACIGSGKTTLLQYIYKNTKKNILYLTYNTNLKMEAQAKLPKRPGSWVQNYHGFVYPYIMNLKPSINQGLEIFVKAYQSGKIKLDRWDLLLIDEYQDITEEIAQVLECIKKSNPHIQIIAVGDMAQKIYNSTRLDVYGWILGFLSEFDSVSLTNCFRLSENYANFLGRVWRKKINGVNHKCKIETVSFHEALKIAASLEPNKIICLGPRDAGLRPIFQNELEKFFPEKFNKSTLFSDIKDDERGISKKTDISRAAIFSTFDSSKGMERDVCFVFGFTKLYWQARADKRDSVYEILRNIFCVGISRGKYAIYFVADENEPLNEKILSTAFKKHKDFDVYNISELFDFRHKELVNDCYNLLSIRKIKTEDKSEINIIANDQLIDLSPCVGIYQEMTYFENYDFITDWENLTRNAIKTKYENMVIRNARRLSNIQKNLLLTAVSTQQERYYKQTQIEFITEEMSEKLHNRLSELLPKDADVQVPCSFVFDGFAASGRADVLFKDVVFELKFVSELSKEHFLQCATYLLALKKRVGVLWNTRNNECYEIQIPDRAKLKKAIEKMANL